MALAPLKSLTPVKPMFLSTGSIGGDPGGGTDPFAGGFISTGGTGPTLGSPGWGGIGCDPFTDPTCNNPGGLAGCNPATDPTCSVTGTTGVAGSGTAGSGGGCSLLNPSTWVRSCILRAVLLILGLIAVIGGIYLLKPAIVEKPLRAGARAAAIAA